MDLHKRYHRSLRDEGPEEIYADLLYTPHYRHVDERMLCSDSPVVARDCY